MSGEALCRGSGLTKSYQTSDGPLVVVRGVDVALRGGELTLLMGPSGSGKTTLISMLAGLLAPTSGQVELLGTSLSKASESERSLVRKRGMGFVFQQDNLFAALTARENVAEVLCLKGMGRREALEAATVALGRVGLDGRLSHLPGQLSGGQRQRVAIARAIAGNPRIVFGDEITAALDSHTALSVMELLRDFVTPTTAVVIVTHDARLERFADRVLHVEDGTIASDLRVQPCLGATAR